MCNTICTCIYNIQKYKTQISTYAIFVRSHFLVQATSQQNSLYHSNTKIRKRNRDHFPHSRKTTKNAQKTIQSWENTAPYFIHIPISNSTPSNERNIMYGSAIICVKIWNYFHTILGFLAYITAVIYTVRGLKFSC